MSIIASTLFAFALVPLGQSAAAATAQDEMRIVAIESHAVGRQLHYGVLSPAGHDSSRRSFPTIFLLHGLGGSYAEWRGLGLEDGPWRAEAIIVLVDVGNSWYFNWPDAVEQRNGKRHVLQRNRWEDYLIDELLPDVERRFRADSTRRAIVGFSMGGYGSMVLALRHPGTFRAVGVLAGALEFSMDIEQMLQAGRDIQMPTRDGLSDTPDKRIATPSFASDNDRTPRSRLPEELVFYREHDPFRLVRLTSQRRRENAATLDSSGKNPSTDAPADSLADPEWPEIYLTCGSQDPALGAMQRFAELLEASGMPFTNEQRPGGHGNDFLRPALADALRHALASLK